ncbi:MAG TPA: hypothetical protein VK959_04020 [Methylophilaceae bacterium]|nr:hypothetical protein [Methylophilaceae bacterium]
MIVADAWVLHHVLQIADDLGRLQIPASRRNERLVHVQSIGKRTFDVAEVDPALGQEDRPSLSLGDDALDVVLLAAEIGAAVNVFG